MVDLIAKSACAGLLPVTVGSLTLSEETPDPVTSIAPFKGQSEAVSERLESALGLKFPAPNRSASKSGARIVWAGQGRALLMGAAAPDLAGLAALTDQSDANAIVTLKGEGAEDALARLVPVDLRAAHFKRGHTARTLLGHMSASITRTGADSFEIMVFRAMAGTLVHELTEAMESLHARRSHLGQ